MNIFNILLAQAFTLTSMLTVCGVVLHDTHVDKAFSSAMYKFQTSDFSSDTQSRPSSNLHPDAEHLNILKGKDTTTKALPRDRNKKHLTEKSPKRGYHGDNICMPLAGEWT